MKSIGKRKASVLATGWLAMASVLGGTLAVPALAQSAKSQSAKPMTTAPATEKALANPYVMTVRNVARPELVPGLPIYQDGGELIGVVSRLAGGDAILDDGKYEYRVPIAQLYAYAQDGVDHFASRVKKLKLQRQRRLNPDVPPPVLAPPVVEEEEDEDAETITDAVEPAPVTPVFEDAVEASAPTEVEGGEDLGSAPIEAAPVEAPVESAN